MADLSGIKPGFRVLASDGAVIGIVDAVEGGERIRLRPQTERPAAGPDFIPSSWVSDVGPDLIRLNRQEAHAAETMNDDIPAGDSTS